MQYLHAVRVFSCCERVVVKYLQRSSGFTDVSSPVAAAVSAGVYVPGTMVSEYLTKSLQVLYRDMFMSTLPTQTTGSYGT